METHDNLDYLEFALFQNWRHQPEKEETFWFGSMATDLRSGRKPMI
jgi:hypothetical protein